MRRYHLDIHELWSAVRQQGGYRSVRGSPVSSLPAEIFNNLAGHTSALQLHVACAALAVKRQPLQGLFACLPVFHCRCVCASAGRQLGAPSTTHPTGPTPPTTSGQPTSSWA
jgi:hypothetical protein